MEQNKISLKIKIVIIFVLTISYYLMFFFGYENKLSDKPPLSSSNVTYSSSFLFETNEFTVLKKINRKESVFTQGLFMDTDNTLIESSGLYKQSYIHKFNVNSPDDKIFKIDVAPQYFAEGITLFKNKIYQLTWREGKILIYNYNNGNVDFLESYNLTSPIVEGWGITNTDKELIISDGSSNIYFLNEKLEIIRNITVHDDKNNKFTYINELETVNNLIFANLWLTNKIIIINAENGLVVKIIDFGILTEYERKFPNKNRDVLNGIAYDKKNDCFYITGKNWSHIYYIKLKHNKL